MFGFTEYRLLVKFLSAYVDIRLIQMVKHKMLPMPDANVGEVLGLAEIIYAYGEKVKISFLSEELRMDIDDLGDVMQMAELLHIVRVKNGVVQLTVYGEAINLGTINDKKSILRKNLVKVEPFKTILRIIEKEGRVNRKTIVQRLRERDMFIEDEQRFHKLMLTWGGYAEIFQYDGSKQVFTLPGSKK